jgi:CRISPR associated protein Cas1
VLGLCLPPAPHSVVRIGQYRKTQGASFALALAINWVEAKILNSRRVLQRLAANREELEITPHLLALGKLAQNCQQAGSLDTLRGCEGTAAGRYFECYAGFSQSMLHSSVGHGDRRTMLRMRFSPMPTAIPLDRRRVLQQILCEVKNGLPIGPALEPLALNAL